MASMKSSSSSSSAAATTTTTELIYRCSVGSVISITSNSSMRYEGVVESVHLPDELICLSNVRSFGTEGRRKDSALVLPDDRVFDNVQFRGSDIKEWQVLSASRAVQVLAFPHDPAIIQCRPLHPTLGGSEHNIELSHEDGFDPNMASKLTMEESLPSASPMQSCTSISSLKLSANPWKQPTQGVSGILGGVTCVRPYYSMDLQPTSTGYNWNLPTQRSSDNMSLNHTFSSQVPRTSSTPFQTGSLYVSPSLDSSPITLHTRNLSPDVIPTNVAPDNFPCPSFSFGSSATIPSKDTYVVSVQAVDRLSSHLGSCAPPQSLSQSMASKNQTSETIHFNEMELSSQESPNHVFPTGPIVGSFLPIRDDVPKDMEPLKTLVPDLGSRESKVCNKLIPSLSTHAKTSSSTVKSSSHATTLSLYQPSVGKMNKDRVHDNMKVAGQPESNVPFVSSGKAIKSPGQTNVDNMKNESADSRTFQQRQPRKMFRRTNKVSQLPTNYLEEFFVQSVDGESDKTRVINHSSQIVHPQMEQKGTTRNIYVRKSEKVSLSHEVVHPKEDLFESTVTLEGELTKGNSKMSDQQKKDAEPNCGKMVDQPSGRFPNLRGSAGGTRRGKGRRSQAESIGKHVT